MVYQIRALIGAAGANQVTEDYTFDPQTGLLTNQKAQKGATTLLDLSYEYDRKQSVGTRNGKTGHLSKIVNNLNNNKNREYEYDALGRLTKAKGGTNLWQQQYVYDRFGNREWVMASGVAADNSPIPSDGIVNLSYNWQSNRITTTGFEYDAAGNQTRALGENGTWLKYEYDAANRLRAVKRESDGAYLQTYTYSATNARVFSHETQTNYLTIYATLGGTTLSEYTENVPTVPRWTKSYTYLGDSLLSTSTPNGAGGETTEYSHPDRLGTRVITNQQTGASSEQTTLPFGTALNAESTFTNNNKRFTSYDRSAATGLDYAINRHYDSKQGRFTQIDPIGMQAVSLDSPQTLNLYSYCGNDPINHTDPDGLFWGFLKKLFKWILIAIAVIVAIITIVKAPLTIAGILGSISAGAGAASAVLGGLGFEKAAMILGLVAIATGFGSIIAARTGKGLTLSLAEKAERAHTDFLSRYGILTGVGAVANSFRGKKRENSSEGDDDKFDPFRTMGDIIREAARRRQRSLDCAKRAQNKAREALKENAKKYPIDRKVITKTGAWGAAGAAGGRATAAPGKKGKAAVIGAIVGALPSIGDRIIDRVDGYYEIHWEWQRDMKNCGFIVGRLPENGGVPAGLNFPL